MYTWARDFGAVRQVEGLIQYCDSVERTILNVSYLVCGGSLYCGTGIQHIATNRSIVDLVFLSFGSVVLFFSKRSEGIIHYCYKNNTLHGYRGVCRSQSCHFILTSHP